MRLFILLSLFVGLSFGGLITFPWEKEKQLDWWQTTVFYQIYPRSYADSDGDGIGDLNGITSKLEYIKDLGVGAIWMSPMFKSPMYDFGYDIADFYEIQDEYGTMEDFEALMTKATSLGIKVVLDLVPNHTSNESMWFEEALKGNSTYYDYFIWEDGVVDSDGILQPPNNWLSHFRGSAWEYREEVGKYYLHQFAIGQPDLNYRNPAVVNEMKNIIRFWLNKGVAGFRVDAVNCLYEVDKTLYNNTYPDEPPSGRTDVDSGSFDSLLHIYTKNQNETYYMVYQFRDVLKEFEAKDGMPRVMMTEVYSTVQDVMKYYGEGDWEGAQMPFNFDLITDVDATSSANDIKRAVDKFITYKPVDKDPNWVVGNHDNHRTATRYGSQLVDAINMIVLLLPGVGVTYMGEEIGMVDGYVSWEDTVDLQGCNAGIDNYQTVSRDPERTPFQWSAEVNAGFSTANKTWLPVAEGYETLNVEVQKAATRSHLKVYKSLLKLRQDKVFRYGRYDSLALTHSIFAFKRWYKNNNIYLVVVNMKNTYEVVDLTYFEDVCGKLEVEISSVGSPKRQGDKFYASSLPVAAYEGLVLKTKKGIFNLCF